MIAVVLDVLELSWTQETDSKGDKRNYFEISWVARLAAAQARDT